MKARAVAVDLVVSLVLLLTRVQDTWATVRSVGWLACDIHVSQWCAYSILRTRDEIHILSSLVARAKIFPLVVFCFIHDFRTRTQSSIRRRLSSPDG